MDIKFSASSALNILKEKKVISNFISEISDKYKFKLLYSIGFEDALSMMEKPGRKKNYLKVNLPRLEKHITENGPAKMALIFWSLDALVKENELNDDCRINYAESDEEKKNKQEEKEIHLAEDAILDILFLNYDLFIKYLNNKSVWKAYLISFFIFTNEKTELSEDFKKEFLEKFSDLDSDYLAFIQKEILNVVNKRFTPDKVEDKIKTLKEEFVKTGDKLIKIGESLKNGKFPSKEELVEVDKVKKTFDDTREFIFQYGKCQGIETDKGVPGSF